MFRLSYFGVTPAAVITVNRAMDRHLHIDVFFQCNKVYCTVEAAQCALMIL